MNKCIDADKLIAEIERQILDARSHDWHISEKYCEEILNFVHSLQQEQPEVDLEEEIEKQIRSTFYDLEGIAIMGTSKYASVEDMVYIARHFYELGKSARKEE